MFKYDDFGCSLSMFCSFRLFLKDYVCFCRDVSSLHYDPTQEEHTAFEAKTEEPKKERYYINSFLDFRLIVTWLNICVFVAGQQSGETKETHRG